MKKVIAVILTMVLLTGCCAAIAEEDAGKKYEKLTVGVTTAFSGNFLSGALGGFGMGSKVSIIPIWLVLAALAFSTLVGVVSGYSPAQRAMNMSVLEGLKNE